MELYLLGRSIQAYQDPRLLIYNPAQLPYSHHHSSRRSFCWWDIPCWHGVPPYDVCASAVPSLVSMQGCSSTNVGSSSHVSVVPALRVANAAAISASESRTSLERILGISSLMEREFLLLKNLFHDKNEALKTELREGLQKSNLVVAFPRNESLQLTCAATALGHCELHHISTGRWQSTPQEHDVLF